MAREAGERKVSDESGEKVALPALGFSAETELAPFAAAGNTLHRKLDGALPVNAATCILSISQESRTEIPA